MIRRAVDADIPALDRLLFQVHQVHHEARPDLFKAGAKKYTDAQLKAILADDKTPVFVAERGGAVVGYAFCIHKQFVNDNNMTDIKTLYIDDLCVDERARAPAYRHAPVRICAGLCAPARVLQRDAERVGGQRERAQVLRENRAARTENRDGKRFYKKRERPRKMLLFAILIFSSCFRG